MSASPFAPLQFPPVPADVAAATAQGSAWAVARGTKDRHGRGLRHPLPRGRRARRSRQDLLTAAVEQAVDRLGALGEPALDGVVVRVQRVPDHADALLQQLHAGLRPGPERHWASAERRPEGTVVITVQERPLLSSVESAELGRAVYAAVLARCAEQIGRTPEDLDPRWGGF